MRVKCKSCAFAVNADTMGSAKCQHDLWAEAVSFCGIYKPVIVLPDGTEIDPKDLKPKA